MAENLNHHPLVGQYICPGAYYTAVKKHDLCLFWQKALDWVSKEEEG